MNTSNPSFTATSLPEIPLIQSGDDLANIILEGLTKVGIALHTGDALVITSKIVSKAEGRQFDLREIAPLGFFGGWLRMPALQLAGAVA